MSEGERLTHKMKDTNHMLAWLLSAEEHPHLKDEAAYQEALSALEASPEMQTRLDESRAFLAAHPVLTQIEGLPTESRLRIEQALNAALKKMPEGKIITLSPWGVRKNFAWAAMLALLLAGMSVVSSHILQEKESREQLVRNLPPLEAFRHFSGQLIEGRLPLRVRDTDNTRLVSWLGEQGADSFEMPTGLTDRETMGCAYLDGPTGKISFICFKVDSGMVHLFITAAEDLKLKGRSDPQALQVNGRQAMEWHDEVNAYLLLNHEKDQQLPEVFL